jgi:hypothetical protein
MELRTFVRFFSLTFVFLVIPAFAAAQQSLKCEANNQNRKYCGSYSPDQVRFERQISGSPCIEGRTWGVDREGLWVAQGCRAIFVVRDRGESGRDRDYGDRGRDDRDRGDWWESEPNAPWPPRGEWHGGLWERGGACFYKEPGFRGAFFCMRRGERLESMGDYGDKLSSVRVFGNARVAVFDDRNFNGASASTGHDVVDLHNWRVRQKQGHTWNDRISSVMVQ